MILRSAAADEAKTLNAAGDNPPDASSTKPAAVTTVAHAVTHRVTSEINELELISCGESDSDTESTKTAAKT